jgi:hypothetical protein
MTMMSRFALGLLVALPLTFGQSSLQCNGGDDDTPPPTQTPPPPTPVGTPGACMVTGCSGQVCASEPVITTCEYTCSYGCYQYAVCEQQATGACGWTSTPEFESCLKGCGAP